MRHALIAALGLALLGFPASAQAGCDEVSGVCLDDDAAKWAADAELSKKQRAKQYKKNRKRQKVALTVDIQGGRGSAFIDGRYLSPGAEFAPGKHDVQIRDGEQVLAQGVLTVPRGSSGVTITVTHP